MTRWAVQWGDMALTVGPWQGGSRWISSSFSSFSGWSSAIMIFLKVVTSNRNPSHCTHSSHRWPQNNQHLWMKNRHPGVTTLHTPTLGSPAQRTGGGELGEISKHLRTGSCQGFPVELSRAGDFEASTQKIRWRSNWSMEEAARPSGYQQTSWSRTRNTMSGIHASKIVKLRAKTCQVFKIFHIFQLHVKASTGRK